MPSKTHTTACCSDPTGKRAAAHPSHPPNPRPKLRALDAPHNACSIPSRNVAVSQMLFPHLQRQHNKCHLFPLNSHALTLFDIEDRVRCSSCQNPEDEIVRLHNVLLQHLPDYNDTAQFAGGFHPHLSVGQFQHRSLQTEQHRLQTEWQPIQCEMKMISLIYRSPETEDRFVVAEQFPFQTRS